MKITLFQKSKKNSPAHVPLPLRESPTRLWYLLRVSFCIATLLLAGFGVLTYYRVSQSSFGMEEESAFIRQPINRAKLDAVLLRYEKKKTDFEQLKTNQPVVGDPSI